MRITDLEKVRTCLRPYLDNQVYVIDGQLLYPAACKMAVVLAPGEARRSWTRLAEEGSRKRHWNSSGFFNTIHSVSIRVTCKCGKALNVPDTFAGKKGKCPHCKTVLDIPAQEAPTRESAPPETETREIEHVQFRCPKTGKQARLPKALAGASVVCPICGGVHSISQSERLKDLISFSRVVKEEPAEEAEAERAPGVCPSCRKPVSAAGENCIYCGARLKTGSIRARRAALVDTTVRTSSSAVAALLIAAGAVGLWWLGWGAAYAAAGVLAVFAGGWAVVAVRGAVRPTRGEWMGWASLACGLVLAVWASVAASRRVPAEAVRVEPQENAEGLGELLRGPDGSFSFRPPAGMKEVVPSFVLGSPDGRAAVAMKGEKGSSLAVLSCYEPPRERPSESELESLARKLTGSKETLVWQLLEVGGIETHLVREMRYSENRRTASHVVHVLCHDDPGTVPVERLTREFIVSQMMFTPEYMELMHKQALARGGKEKALPPEELENERIKRIEEERKSGAISKDEARRLKEAKRLSEAELRGRVEEWAKNIRRVVHILYVHELPFEPARRRRDSRGLVYSYASELLAEVAAGEAGVEDVTERFSDEVRFAAEATKRLGGEFPPKPRRLRAWFSDLAAAAAEGRREKAPRARLVGRMSALARSKAASSGLDRQIANLRRLDLNLATDDDWVELVMRSVSTFKFKRAHEPAGE